ncbi:MAG: hypothetical protein V4482_01975 [Pseudomonadota bacterium]
MVLVICSQAYAASNAREAREAKAARQAAAIAAAAQAPQDPSTIVSKNLAAQQQVTREAILEQKQQEEAFTKQRLEMETLRAQQKAELGRLKVETARRAAELKAVKEGAALPGEAAAGAPVQPAIPAQLNIPAQEILTGIMYIRGQYTTRRDAYVENPVTTARTSPQTTNIITTLSDPKKVSEQHATPDEKRDILKAVVATHFIHNNARKLDLPARGLIDAKRANHFAVLAAMGNLSELMTTNLIDFHGIKTLNECKLNAQWGRYPDLERLGGITKEQFSIWFQAALTEHHSKEALSKALVTAQLTNTLGTGTAHAGGMTVGAPNGANHNAASGGASATGIGGSGAGVGVKFSGGGGGGGGGGFKLGGAGSVGGGSGGGGGIARPTVSATPPVITPPVSATPPVPTHPLVVKKTEESVGSSIDDASAVAAVAPNTDASCTQADWDLLVAGWNQDLDFEAKYKGKITSDQIKKYQKMKTMLPAGAVKQKIMTDIILTPVVATCTEDEWDLLVADWASDPGFEAKYKGKITSDQIKKYQKMKKMNMPEGAIRQKIMTEVSLTPAKASAASRIGKTGAVAASIPVVAKRPYVPKDLSELDNNELDLIKERNDSEAFVKAFENFAPDVQSQVFCMLDPLYKEKLYTEWGNDIGKYIRSIFLLDYEISKDQNALLLGATKDFQTKLLEHLKKNSGALTTDLTELYERCMQYNQVTSLNFLNLSRIWTELKLAPGPSQHLTSNKKLAAPAKKYVAMKPSEDAEWNETKNLIETFNASKIVINNELIRKPSLMPAALPKLCDDVKAVESFLIIQLASKKAATEKAALDQGWENPWTPEKVTRLTDLQQLLTAADVYAEGLCQRNPKAFGEEPISASSRAAAVAAASTPTTNAAVSADNVLTPPGTPTPSGTPTPFTTLTPSGAPRKWAKVLGAILWNGALVDSNESRGAGAGGGPP